MDDFYLFQYRSIHDVMRAESALKRAGVSCRLVPVPTSVRSDCGMGVAVPPRLHDSALDALRSSESLPEAVYRQEHGSIRRIGSAKT